MENQNRVKERTVLGPPGCGKTSYLGNVCHHATQRFGADEILVCSLTRAAAAVVAGHERGGERLSLPPHNIGTLHAFAYRSIGCPEIADTPKQIKLWNEWVDAEGQSNYRITQAGGDVDDNVTEGFSAATWGDQAYGEYGIARSKCLPVETLQQTTRAFAELWERFKSEHDLVDFHEMLEIALRDVATAPGSPKVLLLDEAQDTPLLGMRLVRKWGEAADWFFVVGDPLQCLYAWAGADPEHMANPEAKVEVLEQSYRVPAAVHAFATKWIAPLLKKAEKDLGRKIVYKPRCDESGSTVEGSVRRISPTWKQPDSAVGDAMKYVDQGKECMFVASCSYMLLPLISSLRKNGIPFHNPYRAKQGLWNPLAPSRGMSSANRLCNFLRLDDRIWKDPKMWNGKELWSWIEIIESKGLLKRGAKEAIKHRSTFPVVHDPEDPDRGCVSLGEMTDWFLDIGVVADLIQEISDYKALPWIRERLLAPRRKGIEFPMEVLERRGPEALKARPSIVVGTIHSLKGSESDVVYVMPDLSRAGMDNYCSTGSDHDGILRAFYVAVTRARESLVLMQRASPWAVSWS